MQTPPLLILSRWSACTKLNPSNSNKLSGVAEPSYVSDKRIKSYLYAFNCVNFDKLFDVKLLRFQWETENVLFFF